MEATWDQWLEHPVVRLARENVPRHASALDLLTETMRLVNEIDDRFPGLSMSEVMNAREMQPSRRKQIRARLLAAGATPADVATIVPTAVDLALTEDSWSTLVDKWGMSMATRVVQIRTTPDEDEMAAAALVLDEGHSMPTAAFMVLRGKPWLRRAVERTKHHRARMAVA